MLKKRNPRKTHRRAPEKKNSKGTLGEVLEGILDGILKKSEGTPSGSLEENPEESQDFSRKTSY